MDSTRHPPPNLASSPTPTGEPYQSDWNRIGGRPRSEKRRTVGSIARGGPETRLPRGDEGGLEGGGALKKRIMAIGRGNKVNVRGGAARPRRCCTAEPRQQPDDAGFRSLFRCNWVAPATRARFRPDPARNQRRDRGPGS